MELLRAAWVAYSFTATLGVGLGIAAVVIGLATVAWLPAFLRYPLILAGTLAIVGSAMLQAGQARGVHLEQLRQQERATAAEATRADLAEKTRDEIAARAAADNAQLAQKTQELEKLLNDQSAQGDAECLDRGIARRLRDL